MSRLKVNERAEQVGIIGGRERDRDIAECRIGLNELPKAAPAVESMEGNHVYRVSGAPQGDDVTEPKQEDCETVSHFGTLRTIPERATSNDEENGNVQLEKMIPPAPLQFMKENALSPESFVADWTNYESSPPM